MGFSKFSFEGRQKELRILRRGLIYALLAAIAMQFSSVPILVKYAEGLMGSDGSDTSEELAEVEIVEEEAPEEVEEEEVTSSPPAEEPPPAETSEPTIPDPPSTESVDTIPVPPEEVPPPVETPPESSAEETSPEPETSVENEETSSVSQAENNNQQAIAPSPAFEGEPTTNAVTEPEELPEKKPEPVERRPVQEVARARPPKTRVVSCNPCSLPEYPPSERRENLEGTLILNVIFDEEGEVLAAAIEQSSGNDAFDQAALQEARENWRFDDPFNVGGEVSIEVAFVIEGSEQAVIAETAGAQKVVELPVQRSAVTSNK